MGTFLSRLGFLIKSLADDKHTVFAKNAGIPTSTFQNYIKGRAPHLDHLLRIRETYNVNIDWLLTGEGEVFASDSNNDGLSDNIIELEHINVIKTFKNKILAKELNQILKEIEDLDESHLREIKGMLRIELSRLRRQPDRRSGKERRIEANPELIPGEDRRSGLDRRVAGAKM